MTRINPEILLINRIFLTVNFLRNLPARVTFATSADIFKIRAVAKIIIRSLILWEPQ